MDPVLAKSALSVGTALSKLGIRAATDATLGSPSQRAIEQVCQVAAREAVNDLAEDADLAQADLLHAVGLLEQLLRGVGTDEVPLVATGPLTHTDAIRWRVIASKQGLDPGTFPLPFDRLVERLLQAIAEQAQASAASGPGNVLFAGVTLARLEELKSTMDTLARQTPLDGQLRAALTAALQGCREADRALLTPDVVLALLHLPDGVVAACFDAVAAGLAGRLRRALEHYLDTNAVLPFHPFEWVERADIRQAQTHAWVHRSPVVTGPLLALGVLDTPSKTRHQLAGLLGPDFPKLREQILARITGAPQISTPGVIFPGVAE